MGVERRGSGCAMRGGESGCARGREWSVSESQGDECGDCKDMHLPSLPFPPPQMQHTSVGCKHVYPCYFKDTNYEIVITKQA